MWKNNFMKFFKHINLLLLLILFVSCLEDTGDLSIESILDRGSQIYPPGADSIFISMGLPSNVIPELEKSKVIDGSSGGLLEIYFEHSDENISIKIDASLTIPPGAFSGSERIWMVLNNETGTIWFYPHLVFSIPVQFDIIYEGVNLFGSNPNNIDFIFQNNDGTIEQVNYTKIVVYEEQEGYYLRLMEGMLNHFSRYGWSR